MNIKRYYSDLSKHLEPNKALIIFGARQVGKTTLINDFLSGTTLKYLLVSGDNIRLHQVLGSQNLDEIKRFVEGYELIVIDEAQRIPHIGMALKMMVDHVPGIHVIVTGSASFELAGQIGEPLTGRKRTLSLYPISQLELSEKYNAFELKEHLENYLIFGAYPEVIMAKSLKTKRRILEELTSSYLLKDILELENVKSTKVLLDLLRLLAYQVGSEVSLTELATQLAIDYKTVARYIDLFEKSFVIYSLRGFSRNLRKEMTKKAKYYFYDNGVRNAIISNFNKLSLRNDIGALWENFIFMERIKKRSYKEIYANDYFWRTWDKKEIDLIEERGGKLFGYEFKWKKNKTKAPKDFLETYANASFKVIHQENYLDFVG